MRKLLVRTVLAGALAVSAAGCFVGTPPEPAAPRDATPVAAGFEKTWNATIDHFAEGNIPIAAIEKASGLIATARLRVGTADAPTWADCGTGTSGLAYAADGGIYNVLVRGDERTATVRVTAAWSSTAAPWGDCSTKGVWESAAERAIKERAERP